MSLRGFPAAASTNYCGGSDFGPIEDSNLSANFRSAENAKLGMKRVSAPDPEHPFQTLLLGVRPCPSAPDRSRGGEPPN
ncbi:hypothetical protein GFL43_34020 [Rhizobium laguerreae]|nr:hypothetical protein [Rhizobium laguerreae]OOO42101.1 hypothetical protein BS630_32535 [Rhizobium laguerreae]